MGRMGEVAVARRRVAVTDSVIVAWYWGHVEKRDGSSCWWWTGAISGKGHGRFQIGDVYQGRADGTRRRKTIGVIAHRFGFALWHSVDELLTVPLLAHECDTPPANGPTTGGRVTTPRTGGSATHGEMRSWPGS